MLGGVWGALENLLDFFTRMGGVNRVKFWGGFRLPFLLCKFNRFYVISMH